MMINRQSLKKALLQAWSDGQWHTLSEVYNQVRGEVTWSVVAYEFSALRRAGYQFKSKFLRMSREREPVFAFKLITKLPDNED